VCPFFSRDHHHYIHSQIKQRQNNRNRNNNQTSLIAIDAAECIDDDIEFVAGLNILLAKGSLILNDVNAQMVGYNFQLNLKYKRFLI